MRVVRAKSDPTAALWALLSALSLLFEPTQNPGLKAVQGSVGAWLRS